MIVYCPNCKDIQMILTKHRYSYKDGVPILYLTEHYCGYCKTVIMFSTPVTYARVVVK